MICHRSSTLPVRTPPKNQNAYISRSDSPGISQEDDIPWEHDEPTGFLPMLRTATPCLSTERSASHERSDSGSPKRKRANVDMDDLPSSSPPGSTLPLPLSNKRQHLNKSRTGLIEIASTPEISPARRDLQKPFQFLSKEDPEVVGISEDDSCEDSSSTDSWAPDYDSRPHGRQASLTLSSPTRAVPETQTATTQAIYQDPTQDIDLDVPPPDEGWDDESLHDGVASGPNPNTQPVDFDPALTIPETQFTLPDTQGLLDRGTYVPDFDIAEPDNGWDGVEIVPSPSPLMPTSRSSSPRDAANGLPTRDDVAAMNDWFDSKVAFGYHYEDVVEALKVTSTADCQLADHVLSYMNGKGKGQIPQDKPGVWTESDDADLHSIEARRVKKMEEKHGQERCDYRLRFNWHYGAG